MNESKQLYRSKTDRVIGGVSGGLGEFFSVDSNLIRIGFVLLALAGGSGFLLYLICWLIIPEEGQGGAFTEKSIQQNVEKVGEEIRSGKVLHNSEGVVGFWLIIIGVLFLLVNIGIFAFSWIFKLWPLILIVLGWQLYTRQQK
jgi:phage shock protein PspC (stress-responsive transcriptional regulator)